MRLDLLLDRALAVLPEHIRDRVVVFGSAPMVLAGLKPDVGDLDLFVSHETFEELVAAGFRADENQLGYRRVVLADDVEVFKTWPGLGFDEVFAEAAPVEGSRGLRVASLRHVLDYKIALGREKLGRGRGFYDDAAQHEVPKDRLPPAREVSVNLSQPFPVHGGSWTAPILTETRRASRSRPRLAWRGTPPA